MSAFQLVEEQPLAGRARYGPVKVELSETSLSSPLRLLLAALECAVRKREVAVETCFIAMPISTPADLVERYENDSDHFLHVLDHLFTPAIENVGLKPISPLTAGSSVIHAEIIKQITDAQLVLCDMSTLNANVFFELGVRTALDRPVCLVVDHITGASPFDLSLVNHYKYNPALAPWVLKDEIPRLQKHLEATLAGGEHNAMWSIVSLSRAAEVRTDPGDPAYVFSLS